MVGIEDVAQAAGVSVSTVGRLGVGPGIHPEELVEVRSAIDEVIRARQVSLGS